MILEDTRTNLSAKAEDVRKFLGEALEDFQKDSLQDALEKMTVSGTLVQEMIRTVKKEKEERAEKETANVLLSKAPDRHVMWYEVQEKYFPKTTSQYAAEPFRGKKTDAGQNEASTLYTWISPEPETVPRKPSAFSAATTVTETSIDVLELSVRSENCLRRMGIMTVEQLLEKTPEELKRIRNFGQKSLEEVTEKLMKLHLKLREDGE